MYAQMGQNIGGMIKEYGLNKVKRAKLTGEIEAHYKDNPEALSQIGMSGDEAQDKKDYTEREKFLKNDMSIAQLEGLAGRLARGEVLQAKRSQIEAQEANTRNVRLEGDLSEATQTNKIAMSALKNEAMGLQNEKFTNENAILATQSADEKNRLEQQGRLIDARIDNLRETTRGLGGANDIFDLTKDARIAQVDLETSRLVTNLTLGAAQIEKLQREIDLLGINDTQERRKLEAQIGGLEAAADRDLAEAELLRRQSKGMEDIVDPTTPGVDEPSAFEVDPKLGAQGDLAGKLKGTINYLGDFLFGETAFEKDKDAKARVNALRMQLMPAFIGTLSDKGAEWALKEVEDIIPGVNDTDGAFRSKMQQLPSILAKKLEVDRNTVKFKLGTASQQLQAAQNAQQFPGLIISLKDILEERSRASQGGKTSTNIKFEYIEE